MRFKWTLAIIASLLAAPAVADDRPMPEQPTPARGVYLGVFGGGGFSTSTNVTQLGTAFFTEAEGGPLAVNAKGRTDSGGGGFVGGQIGYEWSRLGGSARLRDRRLPSRQRDAARDAAKPQ